jgi:hypothetical protein
MASSFSRASGSQRQPVLFQGALLKPGGVPGQWTLRYFTLTVVQQELVLKWWTDNNSKVGGQPPTGCLFLRSTCSVAMKSADVIEMSGVLNPEKPRKRRYSLKSSPTNRVDDLMAVIGKWLAAKNRERPTSIDAALSQFDHLDVSRRSTSASSSDEDNRRHSLSPLSRIEASLAPNEADFKAPGFFSSEQELTTLLARALFAYAASDGQSDELSFPSGATIRVFEQADSGWWRGALEGSAQHGWFPSNFVRPISSRVVETHLACTDGAVLFHAIATHKYDNPASDAGSGLKELAVVVDDVISVTVTHTNGWWFGTNSRGESGWMPSNYFEILT